MEAHDYVHCDLAARNILVTETFSSDGVICKIADFHSAYSTNDGCNRTGKGRKIPVKWTAPEVISGGHFTTKSDVWSFGVVLYEIITYGRVPYTGMSNADVSERVKQGYRLPRPSSFPDKVYDIMLTCWKDSPEERPTFESLQWQLYVTDEKGYAYASVNFQSPYQNV